VSADQKAKGFFPIDRGAFQTPVQPIGVLQNGDMVPVCWTGT
jgi:hypothetical protein